MVEQAAQERFAALVKLLRAPGPVNPDYVAPEAEACAQAGVTEAMLLAAAIAAAGWERAQDWDAALDWLAAAAEAGSSSARAQLSLLTGRQDENWRALARSADIEAWRSARTRRVARETPWIAMSEGFLDARQCAWLIARARPLEEASLVYDAVTGKAVQHDVRTNTAATFQLIDIDAPMLLLRERVANTVGVPVSHLENLSIFHYLPGQRFTSHVDYLTPSRDRADIAARGQRAYTFLVYLNDDFDAGGTHFIDLGQTFRGKAGEALFWRNATETGEPDPRTTHEGLTPTRGEKWVLSIFIRDKPQTFG
ncbi:MAG: 2OG-Fe(II) oxygenase [Proteobacteria bacterium]|nr:2OG-Fe(II) oxygenase [Pseudomonadota bacterium]